MSQTASTVLITGSNGGLGIAIAEAFLAGDADCQVYAGVRDCLDRVQALARSYPDSLRPVSLDVTKAADWRAATEQIVAETGRIDVLINNAGAHRDGLLASMPAETWSEVLDTNLNGAFLGCQAVVRTMIGQRYGRIVNIASLSALMAPKGQTNYAAAKAGVVALTRSLAKEVARTGITVNAVLPGYIDTDALSDVSAEERKRIARETPMRRFGKPEEVAAAVRFLASPEASYVTGAELKIDGGIY